jgi:hypothetical protein
MAMFNHDHDEDLYEDDEKFYRETVYNEDYYIEQEQEIIRQSNLELELERLEDENIRDMREEGLVKPILIEPDDNELKDGDTDSESSFDDPADQPF